MYFDKNLHLGGTGTSETISPNQIKRLWEYFQQAWDQGYRVFHHGDCVNADTHMHEAAESVGFKIIIHPPLNSYKRAFCKSGDTTILQPFPYLTRNHHIVEAVSQMIAVPKEREEQLRSGTWATVRYARKQGIPVNYIFP